MVSSTRCPARVGLIGTGFIAQGVSLLLQRTPDLVVSGVLSRRPADPSNDFGLAIDPSRITNDVDQLIAACDIVLECSGDPLHATEMTAAVLSAGLPVVTMDAELHVTAGSWLSGIGYLTEGRGDQPGCLAALDREARDMGFEPLVYGNVKGFLNLDPTPEDMAYWAGRQGISLTQVTSFTDGTKIQIEQVLVANGLDADIARQGMLGIASDDLASGGAVLAAEAQRRGRPLSDYLLSPASPPGVFIVASHDERQAPYLRYYKMGEGPHYVLYRPYHLCHLEVVATIRDTLAGDSPLLGNGLDPQWSVATITKHDLPAGTIIRRGVGSFEVRGEAVEIAARPEHLPIGLMADATLVRDVPAGTMLTFDDVDIPSSLALAAWRTVCPARIAA